MLKQNAVAETMAFNINININIALLCNPYVITLTPKSSKRLVFMLCQKKC